MPKRFAGNSPLGRELNKSVGRTDIEEIRRTNVKYGILNKSLNNKYIFTIRLIDSNGRPAGITAPIPIKGHQNDLAARFGPPEEMEGYYLVRIDYRGSSVNRGVATIVKNLETAVGQDAEETEQSNQLKVKGSAFAPPGSGV